MKKTLLLFLISLSSLFLFFLIPKNREWLNKKVIAYWNDFKRNRNTTDTEKRKIARWETGYTYSREISNHFTTNGELKDVLVLLPPSKYFADRKISYHVPEPAVFYYYTGLKTVWVNSEKASQANWMVVARNRKLEFIAVTDKKMLADSISSFKKYSVTL